MNEPFEMDTLQSLVDQAVYMLRTFEPPQGYILCYSGGKDSDTLLELCNMAGVKYRAHYNVTTLDPPTLTRYILHEHPEVIWDRSKKSFWEYAKTHGFPLRHCRWCCKKLKENKTPKGNVALRGVRAAESDGRAKRSRCEPNYRKGKQTITWFPGDEFAGRVVTFDPIIRWKDADVWNFIRGTEIKVCPLYDQGFKRIGCINCPMQSADHREKELKMFPQFRTMWRRLFRETWERRHGTMQRDGRIWFGDRYFSHWEDMWEWYMSDLPLPIGKPQWFGKAEQI